MNVSDLANISLFALGICALIAAGAGIFVQHKYQSITAGIVVMCSGIAVTCITVWLIWGWMPTLYATASSNNVDTLGDKLAKNLWVLPSVGIFATAIAYAAHSYSKLPINPKKE